MVTTAVWNRDRIRELTRVFLCALLAANSSLAATCGSAPDHDNEEDDHDGETRSRDPRPDWARTNPMVPWRDTVNDTDIHHDEAHRRTRRTLIHRASMPSWRVPPG